MRRGIAGESRVRFAEVLAECVQDVVHSASSMAPTVAGDNVTTETREGNATLVA